MSLSVVNLYFELSPIIWGVRDNLGIWMHKHGGVLVLIPNHHSALHISGIPTTSQCQLPRRVADTGGVQTM